MDVAALAADVRVAELPMLISAASVDVNALRILGLFRDDIDDAVDGVGSPNRLPGPRITSIRSMSSSITYSRSQYTPPVSGCRWQHRRFAPAACWQNGC